VPEGGHILVPYWRPSNIRCHSTKYSYLGDPVLGIYAPLLLTHLLALKMLCILSLVLSHSCSCHVIPQQYLLL